jgi:hypothetical protein
MNNNTLSIGDMASALGGAGLQYPFGIGAATFAGDLLSLI